MHAASRDAAEQREIFVPGLVDPIWVRRGENVHSESGEVGMSRDFARASLSHRNR